MFIVVLINVLNLTIEVVFRVNLTLFKINCFTVLTPQREILTLTYLLHHKWVLRILP